MSLKDLFVMLNGNDKPDELENKMPNVRMFVRSKTLKPTGKTAKRCNCFIGDYYVSFKGSICKYFNKEGDNATKNETLY